ncbi:hypothetical protein O159_16620 [Leifsonia xyli subsp. cynodontis DSM 46306]|uniref:HTH cro/C1-type domain-containing protein n=1 Tax=Leifsonia xyli subsp. cynodontis DSM 46306 TaxID=1389489 RepID=U3P8B2_LEIXC|nr:hypothetical protein [Leifsonia xyli]AGW41709.1 hypothetical protein O159_16620 [Leifsonia xyli subsp. cynodontis DSM 46306]
MTTVMDTYSSTIAGAVRAVLGHSKKSISGLAMFLDLSRETASSRVNGSSVFNVNELEMTARFLGITVDDLNELADLFHRIECRNEKRVAA